MRYCESREVGIRCIPLVCMLVFSVCGCVGPQREPDGGDATARQSQGAGGTPGSPQQIQQRDLALEETITLATRYYDQGNYPATIGILTVNRELPLASVSLQIRAKKLLAFSHCILGRTSVCQKYFEEILELDPRFDLTAYETGNPTWDPAFRRAKRVAPRRKGG